MYKIDFTKGGEDYTLEITPSSYVPFDLPIIWTYLDSRIITEFKIEWEIGDFPFGVISPKMILGINYNIDDSNLTDFIDMIQNPLKETVVFGMDIKLKNVFKLWKGSELIYTGVQDSGVEGTYETDTYIQSIETTYIGRYILEQFDTKVFRLLATGNVINPTFINRQSYIDFYGHQVKLKSLIYYDSIAGQTVPSKSQYYWYINLAQINAFYAKVISKIGEALLGKETDGYIVGNTLYNEGQQTTAEIFDTADTINNIFLKTYKQTYDGTGAKGSWISSNNDLYFIGFRANAEWVFGEVNSTKIIDGLFYDKFNNSYKTMWDFFVDFANQTQSFMKPSGYFYKAEKTFTALQLPLYDVSAELQYKVLSRVSSSLTESYEADIDNYEVYSGSSRTDNSLTIPITFYNYPTAVEDYNQGASGWNALFGRNWVYDDEIRRKVSKEYKDFGLYYFENAASAFGSEQAFLIHNYIDGYGATEYNLTTIEFDIAEALDIQSNGCIPKIIADYVLDKYSGNQVKIKGLTVTNELYPLKIEFDFTQLAPPKQSLIFNDYSSLEYYILKYTFDFIENTNEFEAMGL